MGFSLQRGFMVLGVAAGIEQGSAQRPCWLPGWEQKSDERSYFCFLSGPAWAAYYL